MNLAKLRLSMIATVGLLIALSTLFFAVFLNLMGVTDLLSLTLFVALFNVGQWLFAPHLINSMYQIQEIPQSQTRLNEMIENLSRKMGLNAPKLVMANIPIPNAFAYGSPISGSRVAVTSGLLRELQDEEVEAVLGHELGHIKNGDVQTMMFASVLPAIFYFISRSVMMSAYYGDLREKETRGAAPMLIGTASLAIHYVLTLLVLGLSRLREYYADQRSVSVVEDGGRKLSEALAKIASSSSKMRMFRQAPANLNSFKALFIEDPDTAERDEVSTTARRMSVTDEHLVREIASREVSLIDHIFELLSTHPNIVKRLQALQKLS